MIRIQQIIAAIVVIGSAFAIVDGTDRYFPFSNYPMYSKKFEAPAAYTYRGVRILGAEDQDERLPVAGLLSPFWMASFREALLVDRSDVAIQSKLRATLTWYNQKKSELALGQPAKAIRLICYELPWNALEAAALENNGLDKLFREHATIQFEVTP